MKYKHTVDTAVDPMPLDEMLIDIWFMRTVQVAQLVPTIVSTWSKNRVFDSWAAVCGRNINSSIHRIVLILYLPLPMIFISYITPIQGLLSCGVILATLHHGHISILCSNLLFFIR